MPTGGSQPHGITVGPDNNLWIAEWNGGNIAQFSMDSHKFQEFAAASNPDGITTGLDGDVWFTLSGSDHVGKITGIVSAYPRAKDRTTEDCGCGGDMQDPTLNTGGLHEHNSIDPGSGSAAGAGLPPDTALEYYSDTAAPQPIVEVHYTSDPNGSIPSQIQLQRLGTGQSLRVDGASGWSASSRRADAPAGPAGPRELPPVPSARWPGDSISRAQGLARRGFPPSESPCQAA
jgi:hypothetical protein